MRHRWFAGSIAWLLHRLTGVLLSLYILVHLYVLSHLKDPSAYERLLELMQNPLVRISEAGLLLLVLIHSLNGVRITLADLGVPSAYQRRLFWVVMAFTVVLTIAGGLPLLGVL